MNETKIIEEIRRSDENIRNQGKESICKNCDAPIYCHRKYGWIHYHVSHETVKDNCKVCKCKKTEPK